MKRSRTRVWAGVAAAIVASVLPLLAHEPAGAAGVLQGEASLRTANGAAPLTSGNSDTDFTLRLPTGASCTGDSANDGYRVQSYLVPASVDPSTLTFNASGPVPVGVGANLRQPLFTTTGDSYVDAQTANASPPPGPGPIINIPNFDYSVFSPGDIPAGIYNLGIACTLGPASATQLKGYWNNRIAFTTNTTTGGTAQVSWNLVVPPAVTSVSPSSGPVAGGTSVTITGTGLGSATSVTFGGTAATSITSNTATQIVAVAPAKSAGVVDVLVTNSSGTSANTTADDFTYVAPPAPPAVTSLSPSSGPVAGGTSVTITGTGLGSATSVTFGGTAATSITSNTATQIVAVAPAKSAGVVDVLVTTANGTSSNTIADNYTYASDSNGDGVEDAIGTGVPGAFSDTIAGQPSTTGSITSTPANVTLAVTDAPDPDGVRVVVSGSGTGLASVTACGGFLLQLASGSDVILTCGSLRVVVSAGSARIVLDERRVLTVPTGISARVAQTDTGTFQVTDIDPGPNVPTGTTVTLTVDGGAPAPVQEGATLAPLPDPAPVVTSVSPSSGPAAGGTSVTITGTGLGSATSVTFGGTAATSITSNTATQIVVVAPAHAPGAVSVVVVTENGTSAASSGASYTYNSSPVKPPSFVERLITRIRLLIVRLLSISRLFRR